jgi:prepilin-type processing-associated H-X9-DG protein
VTDYNGWLPLSKHGPWANRHWTKPRLWPAYVSNENVFVCPSSDNEIFSAEGFDTNYMYAVRLGAYDATLFPTIDTYGPRKLDKCLKTTTCAIMIDGKSKSRNVPSFDFATFASALNYVDPRHSQAINVLFADGHTVNDNPLKKTDIELNKTYVWDNTKDWPR